MQNSHNTDAASTEDSSRSCDACSIQTADLKKCSRCHLTFYCGRECQRRHWKEHKLACDVAVQNMEILSMGSDPDAERIRASANARSKVLRMAKKSGMPMISMSFTAFGPVGPGLPIPEGVPPNFPLKQVATIEFKTGPATRAGARGNMRGEASYRAYYDDLVADRSIWMTFFDELDNYEHAEHTCGILGTLATIYRQRGALKECEEVLDMEVEVMERYQRSSQAQGAPRARIICCDNLEHKMILIRYNLCFQLERFDACLPLYRSLLNYELKYNLTYEEQNFLFMTVAILGKAPTPTTLRSLSDDEVMRMVLAPLRHEGSVEGVLEVEKTKQRVALQNCSGCGRSESAMGEFKTCTRCESVFYCCRECQRKDWKAHKKTCNAK
jgi:hypothetical protein